MRSTWLVAVVVAAGLVGCGGGGGGDEKRTYLACGTAEACVEMQSLVPADMSCSAPEVPSCDTGSVLATCVQQVFAVRMTTFVYAADKLSMAELDCRSRGGNWTLIGAN